MSVTIARTRSGTGYEFNHDFTRVRRIPAGDSHDMRRDGEWLRCSLFGPLEVGSPLALYLEPLGAGDLTIRTTTTVVAIERHDS